MNFTWKNFTIEGDPLLIEEIKRLLSSDKRIAELEAEVASLAQSNSVISQIVRETLIERNAALARADEAEAAKVEGIARILCCRLGDKAYEKDGKCSFGGCEGTPESCRCWFDFADVAEEIAALRAPSAEATVGEDLLRAVLKEWDDSHCGTYSDGKAMAKLRAILVASPQDEETGR